ncbi:hypothetical protein TNCT_630401 [Trichonephila clavata]|uniref:Uncharacterized protein n=1 Tax=Trichonephila clavata TaxID=2740835 RepID=A0A8X6LW08_TRICU|nr:hypothetical protein TNCT_630401 [Trichonephila clavata]
MPIASKFREIDCGVLQIVQILAIVQLTLIGPRLSAINGPHYTPLDDRSKCMIYLHILHLRIKANNLRTVRSLVTRTPGFVDVSNYCSCRMPKPKIVLNHDSHVALLHHALKCFQ